MVSIVGARPSPRDLRVTNGVPSPEYIHIYVNCYVVIILCDDFLTKHCIYPMSSNFHYLDSMSPVSVYYWMVYPRVIREPNNEMFAEFSPSGFNNKNLGLYKWLWLQFIPTLRIMGFQSHTCVHVLNGDTLNLHNRILSLKKKKRNTDT